MFTYASVSTSQEKQLTSSSSSLPTVMDKRKMSAGIAQVYGLTLLGNTKPFTFPQVEQDFKTMVYNALISYPPSHKTNRYAAAERCHFQANRWLRRTFCSGVLFACTKPE